MRRLVFFLLFALVVASGARALAGDRHARDRVRSGEIQPLDRILPQVRDSYPGTFYDADGPFPDGHGGYRYRIKWLTPEGRVIWLDTDARTGRVVGTDRSERNSRERDNESSDRGPRDPWGDQPGSRDNGRHDHLSNDGTPDDRSDFRNRDRSNNPNDDRGRNRFDNNHFDRSTFPGRNDNWRGNFQRKGHGG
jgi:hypothetical protein